LLFICIVNDWITIIYTLWFIGTFYFLKATGKAVVEETSKLAECIGKTRTLLRKILSEGVDHCMVKLDNDPQGYLSQPLRLLEAVLQECHNTFTACFHSFYPTPALQWACLCDLLNCLDQVSYSFKVLVENKIDCLLFSKKIDSNFLTLLNTSDQLEIYWGGIKKEIYLVCITFIAKI
jgi:hypothetical protein